MTDEKDAARSGAIRHALWLGVTAFGVFVTYIVYVYMYMLNN